MVLQNDLAVRMSVSFAELMAEIIHRIKPQETWFPAESVWSAEAAAARSCRAARFVIRWENMIRK